MPEDTHAMQNYNSARHLYGVYLVWLVGIFIYACAMDYTALANQEMYTMSFRVAAQRSRIGVANLLFKKS